MSRANLVRGLSGAVLASFWIATACSSSDGPTTTPEVDAGTAGLAHGGSSAGAQANGGKTGRAGAASSGTGGRAGGGGESSQTGGHGGSTAAGHPGSETAGAGNGGIGGDAAPAAGAGPEAGSGGNSSAECQPNDDHCPAGKYCSTASQCVDGCKNGNSCASGVCGASHDCQSCISDQECSEPNVCGAAACAPACGADQEGTNQGCGTGLTCCSLHCVSTVNDQQHCGACGSACANTQFCGQSGCIATQLSSLCQVGKIAVILDGQDGDDPMSRALAQTLVDRCPSSQIVREVSQTVADALNPVSGHPVSGSDELLVIAGSSYYQQGAGYMVTNKFAPLINLGTQDGFEIRDSSTNALIASESYSETSDTNDLFALQFMREPSSGSLVLNAYGFTVGGTAAATFYFQQAIALDFASVDKAWFVGKWTDMNADLQPNSNEFTLIASGG